MKTALLLIVISFYSNAYTQKQPIHAILNRGLLNEHHLQNNKNSGTATVRWQQHYRLKDNLLSIKFTKIDTLTQCNCTVYRMIPEA